MFSSLNYAKLSEVIITVEREQQGGSVLEETWEGVYLKDVLDYLGVTEYSSMLDFIRCFFQSTPDIINDSLTILGTNIDGKDLEYEDGYIYAIPGNQPESMWVEKLSKIIINK